MLRASSLGLTFAHGNLRFSLLQYPRCLHESLSHEPSFLVGGATLFCTTSKAKVSKMLPMSESHIFLPPAHLSLSTCECPSQIDTHTPSLEGNTTTQRPPATKADAPRKGHSIASARGRRKPPSSLSSEAYAEHMSRTPMYTKLARAIDDDEAWQTYQELLRTPCKHITHIIPHKYLHQFAALLVSSSKWRPPAKIRTQQTFLRLLSVLNTLYRTGGQLRLWQWNALIACAGSGWRKTRTDDFNASLNVLRDMVANRAPGTSLSDDPSDSLPDHAIVASKPVDPDIVTYTTLLAIAGRTLSQHTLDRAEDILASAGLSPNRITYLAYLGFYSRRGELARVRSVLNRMSAQGFELGIDGLNGCIWAFGRNGRLDIATLIYRILRHNMLHANGTGGPEGIQDAVDQLSDLEGLTIPTALKPDAITYYTLIQTYAYRGHLQSCIDTLKDMMNAPQSVTGKLEDADVLTPGPKLPLPILPIFRAIFIGFARNATLPRKSSSPNEAAAPHLHLPQDWTLEQLSLLFDQYIDLPVHARPNSRTVWCLLVAFAITSGDDRMLLRNVWERLSARYGDKWGDRRVDEFRRKIYAEEFDRIYFQYVRSGRERASSSRSR